MSGEPPLTQHRQDQGAGGGLQETEQRNTHPSPSTRHLWSGWAALSSSAFTITEDLTWVCSHRCSAEEGTSASLLPETAEEVGMSPRILRSFYTCTVESILTGCITAWYGNSTAGNRRALQRVVRTARHIVGGWASPPSRISTPGGVQGKPGGLSKTPATQSHRLLSLLPSGRRFRSIRSRPSRWGTAFSLRLSG